MQCKRCQNKTRLPNHKFCSQKCYWKSLEGIKGENAPNYRKVVGKAQVHNWLSVHYGNPRVCESNNCDGKVYKRWFDWALIKGKKYERNRKNFLRLCRSCHRKYDLTPRLRRLAISNLWWKKGLPAPSKLSLQNLWWQKDKKRTRQYKALRNLKSPN